MNGNAVIRLRRHSRRRGASATELALILPLLMLVVLLCVDVGRFIYTDVALANAVRTGAAYAIMHPEDSEAARSVAVQNWARLEMTGQVGFEESKLTTVTTLTRETPTPQHPTNLYRVRVVGTYDSFVPIVSWPLLPDHLTLHQTVEMRLIR